MSDLYPIATDYLDAHMRLIPLYPLIHGKCGCPDPECTSAAKHPLRSNWQHQRLVDTATLYEVWHEVYGCNGLGWALDQDHIVIDVDPRNGGNESLEKLQKDLDIDLFDLCNAIVKTGGQGLHFYFKKLDSAILGWKMPSAYKGIDVKQGGGFVVIAGSMHASGNEYEWHSAAKSCLDNLEVIPEKLAALLAKSHAEHREAVKASGTADLDEVRDMLSYITPNLHHDDWVKVGMIIHSATDGSMEGLQTWDTWSQPGTTYKEGLCSRKWHSFGKYHDRPVGMGSLVTMARAAGWEPAADSTALTPDQLQEIKDSWAQKVADRVTLPSIADDADISIYEPPGLLGKINDYVYSCSVFPNRNLALACSLSVLTNIIGRKYHFQGRFANVQPNLLILCIAGSSVGKDSVLGAAQNLLNVASLDFATHGRIKSDKDLVDALERNQYAMYYIDEFGGVLQRINNAMKKGGASYLEGIIYTTMEMFTKGDKTANIDLSRKEAIREHYEEILQKMSKALKDGNFSDQAAVEAKIKRCKQLLKRFEKGLPNPFLSMFTTATPRTMELAFSGDSTDNGFLSRAMVFHEYETNPRPKPDWAGVPQIPMGLQMAIRSIRFDRDECPFGRVDSFDQKQVELKIDKDAQVFIDRAIDYFFDLAETQKESGLESLPRRGFDGVMKVCIALAAESGTLTLPMARYAVKLVRSEMDKKIRRVNSTEGMASRNVNEKMDAVAHRICEICTTDSGETLAVMHRQCKSSSITRASLASIVEGLVANGYLEQIDSGRNYGGVPVYRYKATGKQA